MRPAAMVSGEGVELALAHAGIGSRTIAALIDLAIQFGAFLILVIVDSAVADGTDDAALAAVLVVEIVLVLAGYPIVLEWAARGRTVGKMCLGLRVVRVDGGPIGFRQALVRGLAGLVLDKPGLVAPLSTVAGLVTATVTARQQRIGDLLAGTVVLDERAGGSPASYLPTWVPRPLQPWVLSLDLHGLDDHLALLTRQFVTRAAAMTPAARDALGDDLRRRVLAVVAPPPPPGVPTPTLLVSVLVERRRRALAANSAPFGRFNRNLRT